MDRAGKHNDETGCAATPFAQASYAGAARSVARRSSHVAIVRFARFNRIPFTNAALYEPVRSKIDAGHPAAERHAEQRRRDHEPDARRPPRARGKYSRTMIA